MNFKRTILEMEDEQKIKVGCVDGVGYFYVGTAGDMKENLMDYNDRVRQIAVDAAYRAEAGLSAAVSAICSPSDYCKKELKKLSPNITMDGYKAYINDYFTNIIVKKHTADKALDRLNSFVSLAEREVAELRDADAGVDMDYKIVLLAGGERGKFWFGDEARKKPACSFITEAE